jgi:glycosyltransferase involved in cell wall biosynthesis
VHHGRNQGAYAARNTGVQQALGAFITVHDADDWSHPQKLEHQALALLAKPALVGCFSHWVRADEALHFTHWCMETGWIYRNVSSLMLRREAVQQLGYWDNVNAAADTEYHQRLVTVYGEEAVADVLPGVPLAIGRQAEGSLTQTSATHLTTMFQGVRQQYADAYQRWHAGFQQPSDGFLPRQPAPRPFPAPAKMRRNTHGMEASTPAHPLADTLQQCEWWDAGWYLRHNPDLWESKIDPLKHFMAHGAEEGRDPGPLFSCSAYAVRYADALKASGQRNPLVHFMTEGKQHGYEPLPCFAGEQPHLNDRPTVLLCGHQAPLNPFGAERCLVDTARALEVLNVNVVVVLPALHNNAYWQALKPYVRALHVAPYAWWHQARPVCSTATRNLQALIHRWKIDAVHVNTVVHDAPCMAAQAEGIPLVVHAHELPTDNTPLCAALAASPGVIRLRTLGLATCVIANSQAVADFFNGHPAVAVPVYVVPNTLDMAPLLALPSCPALANTSAPLRVGMLSSHQPEKGLEDAATLATLLASLPALGQPIELHLYGPETPALAAIRSRQARGELTNLTLHPYVASPAQALADLDVVLNLSSVKESFGRTVLEAMTSGRAVVCYRWGALPELVIDKVTGFMTEHGDITAVAHHLRYLATHREDLARMGQAAQQRALNHYTPRHYVEALGHVYRTLLPNHTFCALA